MIGLAINLVILAALVWLVWHIVVKFRAAEGSIWERLLAGTRDSLTVAWGHLLWAAGGLLELVEKAATFLNMPDVTNFVQTSLPPKYVAYGLIGIGALTVLARFRGFWREARGA